MKKTALVTGGTHKDVAAMGTLAINIKEITPDLADDFIIFHDGISKKQQALIKEIIPTKFYKYEFPIDWKTRRKNRSLRYFSQMVFCKYECFRLLEEYDRVIWTDYDVLIRGNLKELLEDRGGLQIVGEGAALQSMFLPCVNQINLSNYDLNKPGLNTPLFVVTREIGDYRKFYKWCIEATLQYAAYIDLPEQCIISMLAQKFDIPYYHLDSKKYALHPREDDGKAAIVHASGRPKFWENLYFEEWENYYQKWLNLGGVVYQVPIKEKIIQIKNSIERVKK